MAETASKRSKDSSSQSDSISDHAYSNEDMCYGTDIDELIDQENKNPKNTKWLFERINLLKLFQ